MMYDGREDGKLIVLILAGSILLGTGVGLMFGILDRHRGAHDWQREAVAHHAARWVADENGEAVFKWNDELEAKK